MTKPSLLTRCQGPGAKDIHALVQRAQQAAEIVCGSYADYVLEKLNEIERIAAGPDLARRGENHDTLLQAVRDMRSSAAMAECGWIETYARSLENSLTARDAQDPARPILLGLHLDAIKLAAQGKFSPEQMRHLENELERAVAALG